jgi:hypothetical protein
MMVRDCEGCNNKPNVLLWHQGWKTYMYLSLSASLKTNLCAKNWEFSRANGFSVGVLGPCDLHMTLRSSASTGAGYRSALIVMDAVKSACGCLF